MVKIISKFFYQFSLKIFHFYYYSLVKLLNFVILAFSKKTQPGFLTQYT